MKIENYLREIWRIATFVGDMNEIKNDMTVRELTAQMRSRLAFVVDDDEAMAMVRMVMEHLKGWTPVDLVLKSSDTVSDYIAEKAMGIVERVVAGEPLQYVVGETRFYGNTLKVSPAVLIPRPETEELVDIIVKENQDKDLRVLDLCTGSGCIAVSLARALRFPQVEAVDLSAEALEVAQENAQRLKVRVNFSCRDVLKMKATTSDRYNIIVSNPPYVLDSERAEMNANVLDHEPWMALFVPDDDALRFYRAIADYATEALMEGGKLYFEINPLEADRLVDMLENKGYRDVELVTDMAGKKRFAIARKAYDNE